MDKQPQWTAAAVRRQFFQFFENKGHRLVDSAPIVLKDDPSLMFTNAGMNQFKEAFLGNQEAIAPRVVDSQKCLRVSGKHNDLEEVGHDTYHHTMFEMLGNWSFGDYFKTEAIDWAWELLTEVYQLNPEQLYVTVFGGDAEEGLQRDEEAAAAWRKHVPEARILDGSKKDNFWEMGATGPCGPCSEIHIDLRPEAERAESPGADWVNRDHPQVVEIWNLVFMQYNRQNNGSLKTLPAQHVDTGMGLERLCMALQGVRSNYDTDIFQALIGEISRITGVAYGQSAAQDVALRVIADHLRAVSFAIADGQLPSNTGAGYVIRRILRRAIRYGFSYLGTKEAFIYQLLPVLSDQMGDFFPELRQQGELVARVLREEEASFLRTLEQGMGRLRQILAESPAKKVAGSRVFELYDTYGFPPDLTALILREEGYEYDEAEYQAEMAVQKSRARADAQVDTGDWQLLRAGQGDSFVGYDQAEAEVQILRYRRLVRKKKEEFQVVLNRSPFYPEGGGQVGDRGWLIGEDQEIEVLDTQKEHGLIILRLAELPRQLEGRFVARVDCERLARTRLNHSATHLLHQALRETLGTHVEQKGSLVHPDYLRFDFSHFSKCSPEELLAIEDLVNRRIRANYPLQEYRKIPLAEAQAMGAMALFGEKYGEEVRAIQFGDSIELCGGMHAGATGDIGLFAIRSEGAVAAGVRRIEALSGAAALAYWREKEALLDQVSERLKNPQNILQALDKLREQNGALRAELEAFQKQQAQQELSHWAQQLEAKGPYQLLRLESQMEVKSLREALRNFAQQQPRLVAVVGLRQGAKVQLAVALGAEWQKESGWKAGEIVKNLAAQLGGGGGGQADFAMAGGTRPEALGDLLENLDNLLPPLPA